MSTAKVFDSEHRLVTFQVSVGIVVDSVISSQKKKAGRKASSTGEYSLKEYYLDQFQFVPGVQNLLDGATMKDDDDEYFHVRSASDFSYAAEKYAGDHYRIIGDASGEYLANQKR